MRTSALNTLPSRSITMRSVYLTRISNMHTMICMRTFIPIIKLNLTLDRHPYMQVQMCLELVHLHRLNWMKKPIWGTIRSFACYPSGWNTLRFWWQRCRWPIDSWGTAPYWFKPGAGTEHHNCSNIAKRVKKGERQKKLGQQLITPYMTTKRKKSK